MLNSFIIVGSNVLVIFILIVLGYFCGKLNIVSQEGIKSMNNLVLNIVTPCVIINALQRDYKPELLKGLLLAMLSALIAHAVPYLLGLILIREKDASRRLVLRFASVFSNCGFMAFPLIEAICGSEGLFYGAGFAAVCNLLAWSFGQYRFSAGGPDFRLSKTILNPGILASLAGLVFFFFSVRIPDLLLRPIVFMAGLNTPVPMIIIGFTISKMNLKECFTLKSEWITPLIRLLISPVVVLAILYAMGIRGTILTATMISASAPVGAMAAMFSIKFDKDPSLASKLVSVTSILSVITMTLIVSVAMYLA